MVDYVSLAIVLMTILAIIFAPLERGLIALAGVVVLAVLSENYTFVDAFKAVDWNVIMILIGMWTLSGYLSKSRVPEYLVYLAVERSASYGQLLLTITLMAAFVTMFVDNVLVILLFGGLAVETARKLRQNPLIAAMIVGLAANYMGTALLLGDLPPQMLHSVAGAEFLDFIWFRGVPGSFPLLTLSYILTLAIFYRIWFGGLRNVPLSGLNLEKPEVDRVTAACSIAGFLVFIALASIRPMLGNVPLGAISMSTAIATALTLEILRIRLNRIPSFEEVLRDMEWKVVIFYASLFSLVKGLEIGGWIGSVAATLSGYLAGPLATSYTMTYWIVASLSTVIEHDAIILTTLVTLKQAATEHGIDPWPHLWATAWSGTLGSNATIAGAPALYLSLVLAEKALGRKVVWHEWMKITIPFTIVSLIIHYIISLIIFLTMW